MTRSQRAEWERAIQVAGKIVAGTDRNTFYVAREVAELMALAGRLNRYNETECTYGLTANQQKRVEGLEKRVQGICKELGIGVKFNGDPRGYAVKLLLPSKAYNTWGGEGEGWGI